MDFPWLTVIGLLPLLGAVVVWAGPRRWARPLTLLVSLAVLGGVAVMVGLFDLGESGHQFTEERQWIPQFGVSYAVGVDGIGLTMIALAAVLVPACVLAAWSTVPEDGQRRFFGWVLLLETFMIGVFAARDLFLFYVFFEAMLIPVYFLIGGFGGPQRRYASVKFLLYSLLGGLVMLVAVIGLYASGPGGADGFLIDNLIGLDFGSATVERLLFLGFFIAFAIKAPLWPVHTWLPDAAGESPPAVAVLLVGVLDKVGTFGMLSLCLPLFPQASTWAAPVIAVLAVISVIYGGLLAIGQTDLMRLIAYTSISHFGLIVLGVFAMTSTGQNGAALYMVNHGFATGALFLVAGMVISRRGSARIADFGGLQRSTPLIAGSFLIAGLASLALPGLSSFVSEILVLIGSFQRYPVAAVLATTGIILAAIYILLTYQRMFTGPAQEYATGWRDLTRREAWAVGPLLAVILALGFYPKPVLDVLDPSVARTLEQAGATDPEPDAADAHSLGLAPSSAEPLNPSSASMASPAGATTGGPK